MKAHKRQPSARLVHCSVVFRLDHRVFSLPRTLRLQTLNWWHWIVLEKTTPYSIHCSLQFSLYGWMVMLLLFKGMFDFGDGFGERLVPHFISLLCLLRVLTCRLVVFWQRDEIVSCQMIQSQEHRCAPTDGYGKDHESWFSACGDWRRLNCGLKTGLSHHLHSGSHPTPGRQETKLCVYVFPSLLFHISALRRVRRRPTDPFRKARLDTANQSSRVLPSLMCLAHYCGGKKTIHSLYWQTKNHNSVPVVATDSLAQNVHIFCNFSCNKLMPKNKQRDLVKVCYPKGIP